MAREYSIILPVHNGMEYLKECVASVLGQSNARFRLEVLENASSDGTRELLSGIRDERVRVWPSSSLLSIEENWQRVRSVPKLEYMTVIGHDDLLYPDFLEKVDELIERFPDASLYQTHFDLINEAGKEIRQCTTIPTREHEWEFLGSRLSVTRDSFGTGYVMRSVDFDHVGGFAPYPQLLFSDDQLWIQLTALSYKACSDSVCFAYRVHQDSVSHAANRLTLIRSLDRYLDFLEVCRGESQQIRREVSRKLRQFVVYLISRPFDVDETRELVSFLEKRFPGNSAAILRSRKFRMYKRRLSLRVPASIRHALRFVRRSLKRHDSAC